MWLGQYNAILLLVLVVGGAAAYMFGNAEIFFVVLTLVILLRIGVGIINLLSKAVRGKPIIYDVKIEHKQDGSRLS